MSSAALARGRKALLEIIAPDEELRTGSLISIIYYNIMSGLSGVG